MAWPETYWFTEIPNWRKCTGVGDLVRGKTSSGIRFYFSLNHRQGKSELSLIQGPPSTVSSFPVKKKKLSWEIFQDSTVMSFTNTQLILVLEMIKGNLLINNTAIWPEPGERLEKRCSHAQGPLRHAWRAFAVEICICHSFIYLFFNQQLFSEHVGHWGQGGKTINSFNKYILSTYCT